MHFCEIGQVASQRKKNIFIFIQTVQSLFNNKEIAALPPFMAQKKCFFDADSDSMKSQPYSHSRPQLTPIKTNTQILHEMHKKQLAKFRLLLNKLCFRLSHYDSEGPLIKYSYMMIQSFQNEWNQYKPSQDLKLRQPSQKHLSSKIKKYQYIPEKPLSKKEISIAHPPKIQDPLPKFIQKQELSQRFSIQHTVKQENQDNSQILSLNSGFGDQVLSYDQKSYKSKLRDEFFHIRQFVFFELQPKLEYKFDKILNKKVVLNCYIAWNRRKNRELLITEMAKLQMQLTVQIKQRFPNIESKKRFFKGVGFKDQFSTEMSLTDRKPPIREIEQQFDEQCLVHPIDQILKQARGRQKTDKLKPFNQFQIRQLDEALGLN